MSESFSRLRLARQERLFHRKSMERIKSLQLTVVGCGRNGSFFSILAAYSGFFHINLIDPDIVKAHNINASILFGYEDVGRQKVEVVCEGIKRVDPSIECFTFFCRAQDEAAVRILEKSDVIVSCVDNVVTKNFLNAFVSEQMKNGNEVLLLDLASGAFVRDKKILLLGGQASLYFAGGPCLLCQSLDDDESMNLSNVSFIIPNAISAVLGMELLFSHLTGHSGTKYNFVLYDCLTHQIVTLSHRSRKDREFCGRIRGVKKGKA
jgi:molybdopterin/thiamine biosynthesis adenylyltransferase